MRWLILCPSSFCGGAAPRLTGLRGGMLKWALAPGFAGTGLLQAGPAGLVANAIDIEWGTRVKHRRMAGRQALLLPLIVW